MISTKRLRILAFLLVFLSYTNTVSADQTDWVDPQYVVDEAIRGPKTPDAVKSIVHTAEKLSKKGPWSVTKSNGVRAPSGDPKDYLSWAPYHWPDCNWCGSRKHFAEPGNSTDEGEDSGSSHFDPPTSTAIPDDSTDDDSDVYVEFEPTATVGRYSRRQHSQLARALSGSYSGDQSDPTRLGSAFNPAEVEPSEISLSLSLPTEVITSSSTTPGVYQTDAPKGNAAAKHKKCTPSPTKTMPPSATWTTCPYIVRDGKVNPDVKNLPGPQALQDVSQAIFSNALAYALTRSSNYGRQATLFASIFFVDSSTKMNPNMAFGQIVRGPGERGRSGAWTGILDWRGLVKVVDGVTILSLTGHPDWNDARDNGMKTWVSGYLDWLRTSTLGKTVAAKPNNHRTFYTAQVVALKIFVGDNNGATTELKEFFSKAFRDQVAASGEQPFEAARTRPYHYRCFNLEALIILAKLGDILGMDVWSTRSKYGATIQTVVDYTMGLDPKREDQSTVFPHVAAAMAAYGDPIGKYRSFLQKYNPRYQAQSFWFYDQPAALSHAPASRGRKRQSAKWDGREDHGSGMEASAIAFVCPTVFDQEEQVELAIDVFVTCPQLRPFYEEIAPRLPDM